MNYNQVDFIDYLNKTHWSLHKITDINSNGNTYILYTKSDNGITDHLTVNSEQLERYYIDYMASKREDIIDNVLEE